MTIARTERLIVDYEYGAQSVFALKEAAGDLCEIIWLVNLSTPEMRQLARLMARMGTVVDIADRPFQLRCRSQFPFFAAFFLATGLG